MKKILFLMMSVVAITLNAQVYSEYFNGDKIDGDPLVAGDAIEANYNGWYLNLKSTNQATGANNEASPVVTAEDALFYGDYIGSEKGKTVAIDSAVGYASDSRSTDWAVVSSGDTLVLPDSGAVYTAFLFKPLAQSYPSYRDFFGYEWADDGNTSRGRVFMKFTDGDVQFAVSRNVTNTDDLLDTAATITNGVDQTYLMVMKYEMGDASVAEDDTVRLYINPNPLLSEADQTGTLLSSMDAKSDISAGNVVRIKIRQRGHNGLIGGIRVGTNWEDVLQGASVTGVTLSDSALTIPAEQTRTLVATVAPVGVEEASVSWSSSDESVATVDDEGVVTAVAIGTATITVTTTDGSFTGECAITVIASSGVTSSSISEVSLYPNPSNGKFSVDNSEGADIKVYNITGKLVFELNNISNSQEVTTNLPKGMYAVSIKNANTHNITKLIVE